MAKVNEHYLKLKAGYLFPEIGRRVKAYMASHPDKRVIRMGIGDVTQPLAPAVIEAMHKAVEQMARRETFKGYDDSGIGYEFLRRAIAEGDYRGRGVDIDPEEIIISDGAKSDTANIQELFGPGNVVAVADPVYPVYVDTTVMAGRTGPIDKDGHYQGIVYMPATEDNGFVPQPPDCHVDLIYLCFPNNPTGAVATKQQLSLWVEYAKAHKTVILFDAAYEAFISEPSIPHSIYEIPGAKDVAIEFRSFSKTAGFTGVRCAFTVVPRQLKVHTKDGEDIELRQLWVRRQTTKFNGVSYITQVGAAAVYTPEGYRQIRQTIGIYMDNAAKICRRLTEIGYRVYGGKNAPYIWLKTPDGMGSWAFFDMLLERIQVVGTPGVGFGPAGEGYLRLTAFASPEDVDEALDRFARL